MQDKLGIHKEKLVRVIGKMGGATKGSILEENLFEIGKRLRLVQKINCPAGEHI